MNKNILYFCIFVVITGCNKNSRESATSGKLSTCVSDAYFPLVKKQADEFNGLYSQADVELFAVSTREAMVYFLNDSLKLVVVDRPFNQEEQAVAARANIKYQKLKIAEDALAVIVNESNRIDSISLTTIKEIVAGNISNWNQLPESRLAGSIELVLTDKNSGIYELLKNTFLKLERDIVPKIFAGSQKNVLEYVSTNPQALGIVSVACLKAISQGDTTYGGIDPNGSVRALSIVSPDSTGHERANRINQASIYLGSYPLHYPVYVYFNEKNGILAAGFCSYLASAPGQKIILKYGLVPATMPVRLVQLKTKER